MSHHLDTPLAAQNGQLFIDDLYVFRGHDSTVFVMDVNSNVTGVYAQPGFHPEARYEIKIHHDDAAVEGLTYRISFGAADPTGHQPLQLHVLTGSDASDDGASGELMLDGATGAEAGGDSARVWAGRAGDAFYVDLSLLAIVNDAIAKGIAVDLSGWDPRQAKNSFAGTSVESIVLEIPDQNPHLRSGSRIGVWCATKLATDAGGWRQINRGGYPMMWPIFWPGDTDFSNPANTRHPSQDVAGDRAHLTEHIAATVTASGTSADPQAYGQTVVGELLPDILPYVVGTPATFGFSVRNGRPLADNAPEVMMSLVSATAIPAGLKPSVSAHLRLDTFPYVVAV
jgi:Domain of unknown function (DUF4331)